MPQLKNPFISRVKIKNFRNFLNVDVTFGHKQVIIGENNVGKTNFLRAIQLILDKSYSDNDRQLTEEDFHDSIEDPMQTGAEIEIVIQVKGYEHNRKLVAQFSDAVISDNPATLQFTYRFFPKRDENEEIIEYDYLIFKGNDESIPFTSQDRNFLNIYVIKALRDVERELKANKYSPLYKLVKQYEVSPESLLEISDELKQAADGILELDEIIHIKESLSDRFATLSGLQTDNEITLRNFDIDTERLLYTLQVYMGMKERPISELSLGLANILYISLMLLLLKDKTILPVIKAELFDSLKENDGADILDNTYEKTEKGNYIIKKGISEQATDSLYSFMDENIYKHQSFTILAVEEPEAHLHPVLQRLIYKEVLHNSNTSVIFTSHSTHITSVSPLHSIVHIQHSGISSSVFSTAKLRMVASERKDIERYIDAKRGEIYFGKGVILAEGITEEYLVPAIATLEGASLDEYGIVVCNINSTNFKPYVKLLNTLMIPWILFTDGDYYEIKTMKDSSGGTKSERIYHIMSSDGTSHYRGNEIVEALLVELKILEPSDIPNDYAKQDTLFAENGCYVGKYTFEVDMMEGLNEEGIEVLKRVFEDLSSGGQEMLNNFVDALRSEDYWNALKKIEANIGKGRFAQRLAGDITIDLAPDYIKKGISELIKVVKSLHE